MNGSERLDRTGGHRLTVQGVGLVEVFADGSARTLEPLSPEQHERLQKWLEHEWPQTRNGVSGWRDRQEPLMGGGQTRTTPS